MSDSVNRKWSPSAEGRALWRHAITAALMVCCGVQSGCRAEAPWPQWDSYAAAFLDSQGRVIDHTAQDRTTTEGQAYAMFFALVAGDRPRFDKLLTWTEDNLAQGDLTARLPAWSWGKAPDGSWRILDSNPASDADLWMAYDLCEAGRLWHYPRYEKLGELMAARIAQQELVLVPGLGTTLLPGAVGFHPDAQTWIVNPSYLPLPLLAYFARLSPQYPWRDVIASLPAMLHTEGGFAMDWVSAGPSGIHPSVNPAKQNSAPGGATPVGSYDAIRVYLWAGMTDPHTEGLPEALAQMRGMSGYLHTHPLPPEQVDVAGHVIVPDGPVGFSAAVIPFLHALGMKNEERTQADRMVALRDTKTGLFGHEPAYYDQNLALFARGFSEQRFRFDSEGKLHLKWK